MEKWLPGFRLDSICDDIAVIIKANLRRFDMAIHQMEVGFFQHGARPIAGRIVQMVMGSIGTLLTLDNLHTGDVNGGCHFFLQNF